MLAIDPPQKRNSMEKENLLSYDNNIMLAAIISLLLVILFVLLLHLYAKWFLAQARRRSRTHSSVSVSDVFGPVRLHHHLSTFTYEYDTATPFSHAAAAAAAANSPASKGVDPKFIALYIPLFSYHPDLHKQGLECAICLSVFEEEDVGRSLPKCSHAFHVECIDMWLLSHSSCPVCRSPVVVVAEEGKDVVAMDLGACAPSGSRHDGLISAGTRMPAEVVAPAGNEGEEGNLSSDDIGEIVIGIPAAEVISRTDDILASSSLARTFRSSSLTNLSQLHPSFNCSLVRILSRSRSESRIHPAVSSPPVN